MAEKTKYGYRYKKYCTQCYRKPYRKYLKSQCEKCNYKPEVAGVLDIDHIDGNHTNDDASNLMTLCSNCHRVKTRVNDDNSMRYPKMQGLFDE
jgi:5-methylcytosine-specific restriction endonuclease McrA